MKTKTQKCILLMSFAAAIMLFVASAMLMSGGVRTNAAAVEGSESYHLDFLTGGDNHGLSTWKDAPYFYLFQNGVYHPHSALARDKFDLLIRGGSFESTKQTFVIKFLSATDVLLFETSVSFPYAELQYSWDGGIKVTVNQTEMRYPLLFLPQILDIPLTAEQAATLKVQDGLSVQINTSCYVDGTYNFALCSEQSMGNPYTKYTIKGVYKNISLPPDPVKEGHDFIGWFFDEDLSLAYDGSAIYEGTVLFAGWRIHRHTVTFSSMPSVGILPQTVDWGTVIVAPTEPTRQGYDFVGWYTDPNHTQPYDFGTQVKGNFTLYAAWQQIILTVTFYVDGSIYASVEVPWGSTLIEAIAVAQTDAEVMSSLYEDNSYHTPMSVNTVLTSDTNVHAEIASELSEPSLIRDIGAWLDSNWLCVPIGALCICAGLLLLSIIQKKRGVKE